MFVRQFHETVSKKIRDSEINKIPFMIIVGDQEVENFSYPVRGHGGVNFGKKSEDELASFFNDQINNSMAERDDTTSFFPHLFFGKNTDGIL